MAIVFWTKREPKYLFLTFIKVHKMNNQTKNVKLSPTAEIWRPNIVEHKCLLVGSQFPQFDLYNIVCIKT
jgi:hypothetical protein